jgi:hypothetical protein
VYIAQIDRVGRVIREHWVTRLCHP